MRVASLWLSGLCLAIAGVALVGFMPDVRNYLAEAFAVFSQPRVLTNIALYLLLLAGLFALEVWQLGLKDSSLGVLLQGNRSALADLWVAGLEILRMLPVLLVFFTVGLDPLWKDFSTGGFGALQIGKEHVLMHFVIWFLLMDLLEYLYHRLAHRIGFLWEAHKYHHSASEFTILTGSRIHALEHFGRHLFTAIPMAWIGVPAGHFVAILLLRRVIDMLQHSRLDWDYGWVGRWLVYSPRGHRIHHSPEREHWDKNFGDILVIWDRLFGTYYQGERVNNTVNVSHNDYNKQPFIYDYLLCYQRTLQRLWYSLWRWQWLQRRES